MSLQQDMEETGLDKKNARRRRAGIGRWSMLVSLLTRKIHELSLRQAFGLLIQESVTAARQCRTCTDFPFTYRTSGFRQA